MPGAEDYVTKPFSTPELLARLRAAQRKTRPEEEVSIFKSGDLIVDLTARVVNTRRSRNQAHRDRVCACSDYSLGILVASSPIATSLREIWGPKSEEHRQYLRVYVTHLRQKIETDPTKPSLIKTAPGIGLSICGTGSRLDRADRIAERKKPLASEQARNGESQPTSEWRS